MYASVVICPSDEGSMPCSALLRSALRNQRVSSAFGSCAEAPVTLFPATRPASRVLLRGGAHAQRNHVVGGVAHNPLERAVVGGDA